MATWPFGKSPLVAFRDLLADPSLPQLDTWFVDAPNITLSSAFPLLFNVICECPPRLAVFGGYQGGHLNSVEVFEAETGKWEYLDQYLQEPKSEMAHVTVPDGLILENC